MNSRAVIVHSNVDIVFENCTDSNSFACIPIKLERHYITRMVFVILWAGLFKIIDVTHVCW